MKLSVVVAMYNVDKYINQCINSLLDQNLPAEVYEIILVDDGSTDKTYSIAKQYSDKNSNISLVSQKNMGVSTARNSGLNIASGEYIYFVDSDDYILQDSLGELLKVCHQFELDIIEFKMVRTKYRNLNTRDSKNLSLSKKDILSGEQYISTKYYHDSNCVYFYKREFVLNSDVKFIDGRSKQDLMFNAQIIPFAKRIAHYPLDVYRYVINPNSLWTSTDPVMARKSIDDFLFMTIKYSDEISKLENQSVNVQILKYKQQRMLFNLFKRVLKSDLKKYEIILIIEELINSKLYPLDKFKGKNNYRKILTTIFNNPNSLVASVWLYRIFRYPIEEILIKNYQKKKEKNLLNH